MKETETIEEFNFDELDLDNEFWQFSLRAWKYERLQTCLLECQNKKGLRVNLVLFALWAGTKGLSLQMFFRSQPSVLDAWHSCILEPLRNTRKHIPKQQILLEIRQGIQQKEIQAERIEQALMYHAVKADYGNRSSKDLLDTLLNNLILSGVHDSALLLLLTKLFVDICDKTLPSESVIVDRIANLLINIDQTINSGN